MGEYIMYLRKSRADNPNETVEEVLSKHYNILQDFCERELGYRIPEDCIYREIVSGESIDDRIEIKKVLSKVETRTVEGVIVVDPQRLSRAGSFSDIDRIVDTFSFGQTSIVTPMMRYDMRNKMERRFFQDELMRGRDYLEYTKEILMRGTDEAVKRGCFLQNPPYGYDKIKIGKDWTLTPNDKADTVRLIFDMYSKGSTPHEIVKELKRLGIPSPSGQPDWNNGTLRKMFRNQHYIGKVTYHKRKDTIQILDGEKVKRRMYTDDYLIAEGKHPAIITNEVFNKVQDRIATHPPVKANKEFRNMFAGLIYCEKCGSAIQYHKSHKRVYYCCNTVACSPSVDKQMVEDTVLEVLERIELPKLVAKYKNGDGTSVELQKKRLKTLEKELATLKEQEETQYELLETRKYTQEVFDKRNQLVREKIEAVTAQIAEARKSLPNAIDYKERISTLEEAIKSLKNPEISVKEKNMLLKSIIKRIDLKSYPKDSHRDFKFDLKITLHI